MRAANWHFSRLWFWPDFIYFYCTSYDHSVSIIWSRIRFFICKILYSITILPGWHFFLKGVQVVERIEKSFSKITLHISMVSVLIWEEYWASSVQDFYCSMCPPLTLGLWSIREYTGCPKKRMIRDCHTSEGIDVFKTFKAYVRDRG